MCVYICIYTQTYICICIYYVHSLRALDTVATHHTRCISLKQRETLNCERCGFAPSPRREAFVDHLQLPGRSTSNRAQYYPYGSKVPLTTNTTIFVGCLYKFLKGFHNRSLQKSWFWWVLVANGTQIWSLHGFSIRNRNHCWGYMLHT